MRIAFGEQTAHSFVGRGELEDGIWRGKGDLRKGICASSKRKEDQVLASNDRDIEERSESRTKMILRLEMRLEV